MKRIFLIIMVLGLFYLPGQTQTVRQNALVDKAASARTVKLMERIQSLQNRGIMIGHQDDLAYGVGWIAPERKSDIYSITSDLPAIFGWDLGHLEHGSAYNLDSVPFAKTREFAILVDRSGGINQFSWHLDNPLTGGSAWDVSTPGVVASILPGGNLNATYCQWLDRLADFFLSLRDKKGNNIPILFRPFHEQMGDWFWWGRAHCTPKEFSQLWQFTMQYLSEKKQVHNLIYVFSTSDNFSGKKEFLERYPGNPYADMIGFDIYQGKETGNEHFAKDLRNKLSTLSEVAAETGKIPALTETGYEQIPYAQWWTEVLWPAIKDSRISYVLFWRNAANRPNHYYAPYPGQISEKDFVRFYNLPETLFLNDIRKSNSFR